MSLPEINESKLEKLLMVFLPSYSTGVPPVISTKSGAAIDLRNCAAWSRLYIDLTIYDQPSFIINANYNLKCDARGF